MRSDYIFSSESVGDGHPDKVADYISDSVLDACLKSDPTSRVACETLVKCDRVILAGEITTGAAPDYDKIVRKAIRDTGYVNENDVFHADKVTISNLLTRQSPDIAQGVDSVGAEGKGTEEQGAGDQGIMFGYACRETPELMPAPVMYSHRLSRKLAKIRSSEEGEWLRPDSKSQVSVTYEGGGVKSIAAVVVSTQHTEDVTHGFICDFIREKVIEAVLPDHLLNGNTQYLINPTGRFVEGGPGADTGLTGRKLMVDTYGGWGRHGGGAFSGKDPSKVDRSGSYMMRWVAKNIVAAKLADSVEIQVAYAIGHPDPVSLHVETFGTGKVPDRAIQKAVEKAFSFKPADIILQLDLLRPIYRKTTHYGHFGKADLPWEEVNKTEAILKYIK